MNDSRRWLLETAFLAVALWTVLLTGLWLEWRGERGAVAGQRIGAVALPTLRCMNGSSPKLWTRVEAEATIHYAQMSLATARQYGGSMAHKLAWATEAAVAVELVRICWSEGERK